MRLLLFIGLHRALFGLHLICCPLGNSCNSISSSLFMLYTVGSKLAHTSFSGASISPIHSSSLTTSNSTTSKAILKSTSLHKDKTGGGELFTESVISSNSR
eukprot:NODE_47_length_32105_cov_1.240892.p32 type:complete len:101 gc:universal NODE_47_length_32105_cov_1.240892:3173-3475(+)